MWYATQTSKVPHRNLTVEKNIQRSRLNVTSKNIQNFMFKLLSDKKSLSNFSVTKPPVDFPPLSRSLADGRGRCLRRPRMVVRPGPTGGDVREALHPPLCAQDAPAHHFPSV